MRRLPNPWVSIPVVVAAIAGGIIGYLVTDASCAPGSCAATASVVAILGALATGVGVGVVAILALKSLAEWREHAEREILVVDDSDQESAPPSS